MKRGRPHVDISGLKSNRLTAIRPTNKRDDGSVVWECLCDCGETCFKPATYIIREKVKSCGCLKRERKKTVPGPPTKEEKSKAFKHACKKLKDWYVRKQIRENYKINVKDITQQMIDIKREQLLLFREMEKLRRRKNGTYRTGNKRTQAT